MTPLEEAQVALREARERVNYAQKELEHAKAKVTAFEVNPVVPSYYKGSDFYGFLVENVKERAAEVEKRENAFIALTQLQKEQTNNPNDIIELKTTVNELKRAIEEETSSSSSSRGRNNTPFRNRLVDRDGACVITGSNTFEAAHIIRHSFWGPNMGLWSKLYQQYCYNQEHGIDDIRNGLLLSPTLHTQFDQYLFTIVYENNKYLIKKSPHSIIPELEEKEIQFKGDPELFPSPGFLAYHNEEFKIRVLKASAAMESSSSPNSGDTSTTIAHHYEALDEFQRKWIEDQSLANDSFGYQAH